MPQGETFRAVSTTMVDPMKADDPKAWMVKKLGAPLVLRSVHMLEALEQAGGMGTYRGSPILHYGVLMHAKGTWY